ncbi:MAG: cell wall hydrolase [Lachnospiraceae bacterium]|nr:cell wall hydrolase [Lachnospiraceae bacterium]
MRTKSRKVLGKVVGVMASVLAFSLTGETVAMASSVDAIESLRVGAAEVLDTIEVTESEDPELSLEPRKTGEEKAEEAEEEDMRKSGLVMANVDNSMNVREEPSTDAAKVGILYADCGGTVLETKEGWTKIQSGNLIGWANDEYLLFGEDALKLAEEVGIYVATVTGNRLRIRKEPGAETTVWGMVDKGEVFKSIKEESTEEWIAVEYGGELGYISREYVDVSFQIDHGETFAEIEEREKKERKERNRLIALEGVSVLGTTEEVLLGALIQCESGNQPYEGQVAVGAVVMNRVNNPAYPNTIAGVIYASGQFTPAGSGQVEACINRGVKESCMQAARAALSGESPVGGAMHFRRAGSREGQVIGDHVFW